MKRIILPSVLVLCVLIVLGSFFIESRPDIEVVSTLEDRAVETGIVRNVVGYEPGSAAPLSVEALVSLPDRYREEYINYARIGRPDGTVRHMYIQEGAYQALREGDVFPPGTIILMDSHSAERNADGSVGRVSDEIVAGVLNNVFVMQKSERALEEVDFAAEQWDYYWFRGTGELFSRSSTSCVVCHSGTDHTDSVFTLRDLREAHEIGRYHYRECDLPGRQPCPDHFAPGQLPVEGVDTDSADLEADASVY